MNYAQSLISRIAKRLNLRFIQGTEIKRLESLLRARGYNNCCDMESTGESAFLELLSATNPVLCVDIGANVGAYSKALLGSTDAIVFAFEPLPHAFSELETLRSKFPGRLRTYQVALGDTRGISTLYYGHPKSELASLSSEVNLIDYVGSSNTNKIDVQVEKLDSYLNVFKSIGEEIDFLKIDVEGFEWEVLQGAQDVLLHMRPRFVQLEFNIHQLFRGHSLFSLSELLPAYRIYQLLPKRGGMAERDAKDPLSNIYAYSNFIFVRPDVELS